MSAYSGYSHDPEVRRKYHRDWRQRHLERCLAANRKWAESHRDELREKRKLKHLEIKLAVFEKLGSVCKKCGFSDHRAIQIDHINGGGCKERKELREDGHGGTMFYRSILKGLRGTDDLQLLCANCNSIKRFENKEHEND